MRNQDSLIQKIANLKHKFDSVKANFKYNFPQRKLRIVGVTGTDGKTTTTSLIYHILKQNKLNVAYISTIKAQIGDEALNIGLHVTTPEPWDVPKYLRKMVDKGIEFAILESTSQGLQQNRLWGIKYDAVTITNIKSDHLDYHKSWKNYAESKFLIIKQLAQHGLAVLNRDDSVSYNWLKSRIDMYNQENSLDVIWYSKNDVKNYKYDVNGLRFTFKGIEFNIPLLGEYNLENTLAAINICNKYLRLQQIANACKSFQTPKGRMEVIQKTPFTAIIDFAHTPHALGNALRSLTPMKDKHTKIIVVFGCAGKRDKKRREMGQIAAQFADVIVLTSEDPRDEKLANINNDIINYAQQYKGLLIKRFKDTNTYKTTSINDIKTQIHTTLNNNLKPIITFDEDTTLSRVDAIDFAVKIAQKHDIVFLTGKAHEASQCFGDKEYPWDEHRYLNKALKNLNTGKK